MLKDTTRYRILGIEPRISRFGVDALPLGHHAPSIVLCKTLTCLYTHFCLVEFDLESLKVTIWSIRGWVRKFCHRCYNFVNRHDTLLYYTLIERATFPLYNDANRMHERNKYFELDALKDTWGKTNSTFS